MRSLVYSHALLCSRSPVDFCPVLVGLSAGWIAQLLHKMQTALGGAGKNSFDCAIMTRRSAQVLGIRDGKVMGEVVKRVRWVRSNYLRLDQMGPGDTYVLYFDGTAGWEILPTKDEKSVISLVGRELDFARKYLRGLDFHVWLADRDPHYRVTSPRTKRDSHRRTGPIPSTNWISRSIPSRGVK